MWLLGIELRTSGRTASALNLCAISPALSMSFILAMLDFFGLLCDFYSFWGESLNSQKNHTQRLILSYEYLALAWLVSDQLVLP